MRQRGQGRAWSVVGRVGHEATPRRGEGPKADARAGTRATLQTDLEKRFGHDLNPLEGGGAPRHRTSHLRLARRKCAECAAASFPVSWQGSRLRSAAAV